MSSSRGILSVDHNNFMPLFHPSYIRNQRVFKTQVLFFIKLKGKKEERCLLYKIRYVFSLSVKPVIAMEVIKAKTKLISLLVMTKEFRL